MTGPLAARPPTSVVPEAKVLCWPLYGSTGTSNGSTTPSDFAEQTGETGTTRTEALELTLTAGTVAWDQGYSPQGTATGFLQRLPSGDAERAFFESLFDLSAYEVGQTILLAFDLTLPAGWAAAQATASAMMCWAGDSDVAGWGIETGSAQQLRPMVRPQGAAAAAGKTVIETGFVLADGRRTFIVQMECTAPNVFQERVCYSSDGAAPTLGNWLTSQDFSSGGTAAPDLPSGSGLRIGARRSGSAADRYLRRGAVLLPVWIAGLDAPAPDALLTRALGEMIVWRGVLPRVLRVYRGGNSGDYDLAPDGLADATFNPITLADMFVNVDGSRDVEDHPDFTIITEPKSLKNSTLLASPLWDAQSDIRGLLRISDPPGGYKFAQSEQSPGSGAAPAMLLSCSNVDQSSRNRCEIAWRNNANTRLPRGERVWQAMRFWHDFDFSDSTDPQQHVAICQWYHGAVNAGLNPCMTLTLYGNRFSWTTYYSTVEGMVQADQVKTTYSFPGLSADMRGRWVDVVLTGIVHWDAAEDPWLELYVDSTLLQRHEGPNCYRGPASVGSQPVFEEIRFGVYPGGSLDTVAPKDLFVRRFFVCRNTQGYTLAQVRTALQG